MNTIERLRGKWILLSLSSTINMQFAGRGDFSLFGRDAEGGEGKLLCKMIFMRFITSPYPLLEDRGK